MRPDLGFLVLRGLNPKRPTKVVVERPLENLDRFI